MKELRKLCMHPRHDSEPKMHTIFLWFLDIPEKGAKVYGVNENDHVSPYMQGMAFRYAEFKSYMVDEVYSNGFVVCHKC